MSESLRDQLLKAGFSKSKPNPPKQPNDKSPPGQRTHAKTKNSNSSSKPDDRLAGKSRNAHAPGKQRSGQPAPARATVSDENIRAIQKRREIKAQIKELIETTAIKDYAGDIVFRFTLQNRLRELHIKEDVRTQLIAGCYLITRLNGATWIVPAATADSVRALNPEWAIVTPTNSSADDTGDYTEFPVPDDLLW